VTTYNLDAVRALVSGAHRARELFGENFQVDEKVTTIAWLLEQIDEAQANIDAAREHLQAVISNQRYVGTRVQEEAARALDLLDGEPDGADA
jgi:hypothetical protein